MLRERQISTTSEYKGKKNSKKRNVRRLRERGRGEEERIGQKLGPTNAISPSLPIHYTSSLDPPPSILAHESPSYTLPAHYKHILVPPYLPTHYKHTLVPPPTRAHYKCTLIPHSLSLPNTHSQPSSPIPAYYTQTQTPSSSPYPIHSVPTPLPPPHYTHTSTPSSFPPYPLHK